MCDTGKALDVTQRFLYHFPGANYLSVARVTFFHQSYLLLATKFKCCSPPFLLVGFRLLMNSQQCVLLFQKTANTSFVLALMKRTTSNSTMLLFVITLKEFVFGGTFQPHRFFKVSNVASTCKECLCRRENVICSIV